VTASIGVVTALPEPDGTITAPQNLLMAADRALYRAKHDGHNRMVVAHDFPAREHEAAVTPATSEGSYLQLTREQGDLRQQRDGLLREGLPDGIDGL
jgi:predicted signal transduction protein with EAL and GGDEF domain